MNRIPSIESIMSSPSVSYWLKESLASALKRDSVDAMYDAKLLHQVLEARLNKLQARS